MSASVASRSLRAAEMYLDARAEGLSLTMRTCAERYGVSVGTVHAVVNRLRRDRQANGEGAPSEGPT